MNVPGVQERAKDLLTEAARGFQTQGNYQKASEEQSELGACYWRLGAHDDARVIMREAFAAPRETVTQRRRVISNSLSVLA
jgi:Flp pilus assembly protein TadD